MAKWKMYVRRDENASWSTNGLEFDTEQEALDWGRDLQMRWLSPDCNEVAAFPVGKDPNAGGKP